MVSNSCLNSSSQHSNKNVYNIIYYTIFTLVNFLACVHAAIMGCAMHDKKMIILLLEGSCQCQLHVVHALTKLLVTGVQNDINKTNISESVLPSAMPFAKCRLCVSAKRNYGADC